MKISSTIKLLLKKWINIQKGCSSIKNLKNLLIGISKKISKGQLKKKESKKSIKILKKNCGFCSPGISKSTIKSDRINLSSSI